MSDINDSISKLKGLRCVKPASFKQICRAESELNVIFAKDYKEYLLTYGVISANGIELTGLSSVPRLDVVNATKRAQVFEAMPAGAYVIEEMDELCYIQKSDGKVYVVSRDKIEPVCGSLTAYIEQRTSKD